MLGLTAYPILGPSDYPSRVIFVYIIAEFERKSNFFLDSNNSICYVEVSAKIRYSLFLAHTKN